MVVSRRADKVAVGTEELEEDVNSGATTGAADRGDDGDAVTVATGGIAKAI